MRDRRFESRTNHKETLKLILSFCPTLEEIDCRDYAPLAKIEVAFEKAGLNAHSCSKVRPRAAELVK